jgi:hypothetical protein
MFRGTIRTGAVFFVGLLLAAAASAQVPGVIKFSGMVASGGARTVTATFSVYAAARSETPLWQEVQSIAIDADGRYAVLLGASASDGVPPAIFATGEARWVGVIIDGDVAEQPRVALVSVPYALKAEDATTVGGKPLSAFVLAGDRTGVGPDGLTYVDARVLHSGLAPQGGYGPPSPQGGYGAASTATAGSANYLALFTDSTNLGNSAIYQSPAGRVGINTTTPGAPLHVAAGETPGSFFDVYSGSASGVLGALPVVYRAARGTAAAPTAVQAEDILGGLAVRAYNGSTFTGGRGQVMFKAAENWTSTANGTYLAIATEPTGASTPAVERMRITADGKVGIGATAPGQALTVAGIVESTAGGVKFPDGTTQGTAAAGYTAGSGLTLSGSQFSALFSGNGVAATVSRSDHDHAAAYAALSHAHAYLPLIGGSLTGELVIRPALVATDSTGVSSPMLRIGAHVWHGASQFDSFALRADPITAIGALSAARLRLLYGAGTTPTDTGLAFNADGTIDFVAGQSFPAGAVTGDWTVSGNLSLPSTTATAGALEINGSPFAHAYGGLTNAFVGPDAGGGLGTTGTNNTALGSAALYADTSGSNNVAVGYHALTANTTGSQNVAVGSTSMATNTSGIGNVALGYASLDDNTTGGYNVAVGRTALGANTTGGYNSALGTGSLLNNTVGTYNSAFGSGSMGANVDGDQNAAFGVGSLNASANGSRNAAVGYHALYLNTVNGNSAFGANSLAGNTTGTQNAAFGEKSLWTNSTGSSNSAFGTLSLSSNTTGHDNAAFGLSSMDANTTGYSNTAVGVSSLAANATGTYNVAVGWESLVVSLAGTNTGVGASTLRATTSGDGNVAVGTASMYYNTTGRGNTAVGTDSAVYNVSGNYNTFIGKDAGPSPGQSDLVHAAAIGANSEIAQSYAMALGGVGGFAVDVGIGTSTPDERLQVVGNVKIGVNSSSPGCVKNYAGTQIAGTCSSDLRLKTNIRPFGSVLDKVAQLQPVHYTWRASEFPTYHFGDGVNAGLIAQDVERLFPELVSTDEHGFKAVNYSELPLLTIAAVKELEAKSSRLEAENDALKARNTALESRLDALAARLTKLEKK